MFQQINFASVVVSVFKFDTIYYKDFQVGNVIRFKNLIKTVSPQKKVNVKEKESVAEKTSNAAESVMQKGRNAVEIGKRIVAQKITSKDPLEGGSK